MIFFLNQKHMLDIFWGISTTLPSEIKWSTPKANEIELNVTNLEMARLCGSLSKEKYYHMEKLWRKVLRTLK